MFKAFVRLRNFIKLCPTQSRNFTRIAKMASASATTVNGTKVEDTWTLNDPLSNVDPVVHEIIVKEKHRQRTCLEMIASENLTSLAVLECLGSCVNNKYSEGQPGAR